MLIKVSPLVLALAVCVHPARAQQTTPPPEEPAAQAGASSTVAPFEAVSLDTLWLN